MADPRQSIQNVLAGTEALAQSLGRLAINSSLKDAEEQVNQINAQVTNERERARSLSALGQQLALQLAQSGASAAEIQQTAGPLGPSPGAQFQSAVSEDLQQSSQAFQSKESALDRSLQRELVGTKSLASQDKQAAKTTLGQKKEFRSLIKDDLKGLSLIEGAEAAYAKAGSSATTQGMYVRAILRLAGEDRLNEGDLGTIPYESSKLRQLGLQFGIELTGKHPTQVVEFYRKIALALSEETKGKMRKAAKGFAKSRASQVGVDEDAFASDLLLEAGLDGSLESDALGEFSALPEPILTTYQAAIKAARSKPQDPNAQALLMKLRKHLPAQGRK